MSPNYICLGDMRGEERKREREREMHVGLFHDFEMKHLYLSIRQTLERSLMLTK